MAIPASESFCCWYNVYSHRCWSPSALPSSSPREVLIKQLEHDLVTAATKLKTQKEDTTKKLLAFRQEVRTRQPWLGTKRLLFASLPSSLGILYLSFILRLAFSCRTRREPFRRKLSFGDGIFSRRSKNHAQQS